MYILSLKQIKGKFCLNFSCFLAAKTNRESTMHWITNRMKNFCGAPQNLYFIFSSSLNLTNAICIWIGAEWSGVRRKAMNLWINRQYYIVLKPNHSICCWLLKEIPMHVEKCEGWEEVSVNNGRRIRRAKNHLKSIFLCTKEKKTKAKCFQ